MTIEAPLWSKQGQEWEINSTFRADFTAITWQKYIAERLELEKTFTFQH